MRKSGHDRDVFASSRCVSLCVHARSTLSNVRFTRPQPAPCCQTSAVGLHASSTLSNFRCKRPLHAVVHSLYTPARCRTRPLAVVHSLHTPAPCGTFTAHGRSYTPVPRCRLVVTAPLAGPPCLPSASSPILLCTLRMPLPDTSLADLCVYPERRVRSLHSLCIYVRRRTGNGG